MFYSELCKHKLESNLSQTCNDPSQMVDRQGPKYASIGNCHMVVLLTFSLFHAKGKVWFTHPWLEEKPC